MLKVPVDSEPLLNEFFVKKSDKSVTRNLTILWITEIHPASKLFSKLNYP